MEVGDARGVSLGSLGVGAVALAVTRNPRALADVVFAAIPRAARLGREGFGAELGHGLAGRDVLVMDSLVLRRLDRIDTVVVDQQLLEPPSAGGRALVTSIRVAAQDFVLAGGGPDGWEQLEPDV